METTMTVPAQPRLHSLPAADADLTVTRLYKEYGAFITGYVTGLLGDKHLAEDVTQETMLRAWRHCAAFSAEKGSVRGWLARVAHNIVMDEFRARRSRPTEVAEDVVAESPVDDHADAVVTALQVRDALAVLSPAQRAVLEQLYLNDRTAREAAAILGIPEGTAFSRAFYALRVLRRELGAVAETDRPHPEAAQAAA